MPRLGSFANLAHKFQEDLHISNSNSNSNNLSSSNSPVNHNHNNHSSNNHSSMSPPPSSVSSSKHNNNNHSHNHNHSSNANLSSSPMIPAASSRRSFFGLNIGKSSSNDSQYSVMSDDHHHQPPHSFNQRNGSMVQLKKFFRPVRKNSNEGISANNNPHHSNNTSSPSSNNLNVTSTISSSKYRSASPAQNVSSSSAPTFTHDANNNMIVKTDPKFWDDLEGSVTKKYGKLGKVLGSGAGGSVRLLVRESDGVTFAVKEFVPRRANESVKEYAKKCTAEFCIGSTLHHPNVIQTLDIINENNHFYEVMEYAPIDFFAVVMSGKMTRSEINCCLKQISLGVSYLHSVGLAHRDLKLDNCVVTKDGIVKLIDFGSAVVFKYPFENDVVMAHGIVGSDPYLAPEVLTRTDNYDPQYVDIWSIAIIYCCMTLRRFPWKAPKKDDPSFSLYCMEDDTPHDYVESAKKHQELLMERKKKIIELQKEKEEKEETLESHNQQDIDQVTKKLSDFKLDNEDDKDRNNRRAVIQEHVAINDPALGDPSKIAVKPKESPETQDAQEQENNEQSHKERSPSPLQTQEHEHKHEHVNEHQHEPEHEHEHHHHHHHVEGDEHCSTPNQSATNAEGEIPERRQSSTTKAHRQIHGPYRLMRLLPHAARPIISRMLAVDISERATMKDILEDDWFKNISYCTVDEDGKTINDPGHHHTIV